MLRALFTLGLVAFTFNTFAEDFSPAAKKELERLAGDWRIASITRDGKAEDVPVALRRLKIVENKMLAGENGDTDIGLRITMLGPDTKPQVLDVTHPETKKTLEGIYELTGDQWKMCLNVEGTAERPAKIDGDTAKFAVVVLERLK